MPALPPEFSELEPFANWCLRTEAERYAKRLASSMDDMQAFYDAAFPRLEEGTEYLKNVPPAVAAMTAGSPLGWTLPILPSEATAGTLAGEHVISPLGEYFCGAAAPQVPAAKPARQGTP